MSHWRDVLEQLRDATERGAPHSRLLELIDMMFSDDDEEERDA